MTRSQDVPGFEDRNRLDRVKGGGGCMLFAIFCCSKYGCSFHRQGIKETAATLLECTAKVGSLDVLTYTSSTIHVLIYYYYSSRLAGILFTKILL